MFLDLKGFSSCFTHQYTIVRYIWITFFSYISPTHISILEMILLFDFLHSCSRRHLVGEQLHPPVQMNPSRFPTSVTQVLEVHEVLNLLEVHEVLNLLEVLE